MLPIDSSYNTVHIVSIVSIVSLVYAISVHGMSHQIMLQYCLPRVIALGVALREESITERRDHDPITVCRLSARSWL